MSEPRVRFGPKLREELRAQRERVGNGNGNGAAVGRRVVLTPASAITPERTRWAWAGRIPLGAVTLVAGRQGLGKSTLIASLAADLSRGQLDGELAGEPCGVMLVSYEDHPRSTTVPRLMAAGADLERVLVLTAEEDGRPDLVSVPGDLERIASAAVDSGARLLAIDPLVAALGGGIDAHRDQDVRRALAPLAQLAEEADLAVLAAIHLRKGGASEALDRVSGSIAFTAAARSVLAFGRTAEDDEDPGRVLAAAKSNLGPLAASLAYRIEGRELHANGDERISTSRAVLIGECEASAAELLSPPPPEPRTDTDAAAEWIEDELADGEWHPSRELREAAKAAGHTDRTVQRASKRLGVAVDRRGYPARTHWRLTVAPTPAGATDDGAAGATDVTRTVEPYPAPADPQSRQHAAPGATDAAEAERLPLATPAQEDEHRDLHPVVDLDRGGRP